MKVRYRNDLYGNYILIEIPGDMDSNQYSFKMLEKNKIPGVLCCKVRMEDGQEYWYADINKKKSLLQEYKDKEMQLEEMTLLFQQINAVLEELRTYLINESMVVMNPEYIYRDLEDGTLFMLVIPWNLEEKTMQKLAEFFLEKMNHRDENGVNAAYHFYRQQSQPNFSLNQFLSILEKENILKRQKVKEIENKQWNPNLESSFEKLEDREEEEKNSFWTDTEKKPKEMICKKSKNCVVFLILAVAFLSISYFPVMNVFFKMSCRAFSILLIVFFFIAFLTKDKTTMKSQTKNEEETVVQEVDIGTKETVFFDSYDTEEYLKLQWKERGRKKQFVLKNFPCTVGKMKEEVSLCIPDISVSRIHCQFVEKEGKPAILDMNSTNGTFLNGLPVKTGEILEIEKNDEILLGKVTLHVV